MSFRKINLIFLSAFILSFALHAGFIYVLSKIDIQKEKKEEKPIYISLIPTKEKNLSKSSPQARKIPRQSKVKTPSKTNIPKKVVKTSKNKITKKTKKQTKIKRKVLENKPRKQISKKRNIKSEKIPKKKNKHQTKEKKLVKKQKPKLQKKENKPKSKKSTTKKENKQKPKIEEKPIPEKYEKKEIKENLKIASKNKEINKNLPKVPVPPPSSKNKTKKEEKPPKQLNLSHLKGKDDIFQAGEDKKIKEKTDKKTDKDIMKYLYYVRDTLQENLAYPLMAKRLEIEGTVIIRFVINKDGTVDVKNIKIVKSSGSHILDKQAIITVKNSVPFNPPPNKKSIVVEIPVIFEIIRSYE